MTYQEKLKDPRWQKKRLQILERDDWVCQCCESKEKTLTVHHIIYHNNPWDAKDDELQTLCEKCHIALGSHPKGGIKWVGKIFRYIHCPLCGCEEMRDKGSFDKCDRCGHTMLPSVTHDLEGWGTGLEDWPLMGEENG